MDGKDIILNMEEDMQVRVVAMDTAVNLLITGLIQEDPIVLMDKIYHFLTYEDYEGDGGGTEVSAPKQASITALRGGKK